MVDFPFSPRYRTVSLIILVLAPAPALWLYNAEAQRRPAAEEAREDRLTADRDVAENQDNSVLATRRFLLTPEQQPAYTAAVVTQPGGDVTCVSSPLTKSPDVGDTTALRKLVASGLVSACDRADGCASGRVALARPTTDHPP